MINKAISQHQSWAYLSNTWSKYIAPPAKPCPGQLKIFSKLITRGKFSFPRKALILGATPELRNLVLKHGFQVTVCDISIDMIKAMTQSVIKNLRYKEKTIVGDWLSINLPSHSFDLIMGDGSLNQLLESTRVKKLLIKIKNLLSPHGILLFREVIRSSKKTINKFRKRLD
ncbi:MAG: class I SAM-dependent methyltransferase [Patescibacteria group bacterium]|nr:class I SAM-dependent methyltransferase [Patescibacteria group bacterium]MDD5121018.1 class I SAM-dependent methyltransferase [Patescibacteria group bacterium]MDD5221621.1 class I SAM-dependent methyltransferase [Patescibacteria group bacterium]MDD5396063.1 class I SAM-dependent methyltransferase [Patescibacteria group bacterium]